MDTLPLLPVIAGGIIFLSRRYCVEVKQNDDNVQFSALQHEPSRVVGINFRHAEPDLETLMVLTQPKTTMQICSSPYYTREEGVFHWVESCVPSGCCTKQYLSSGKVFNICCCKNTSCTSHSSFQTMLLRNGC